MKSESSWNHPKGYQEKISSQQEIMTGGWPGQEHESLEKMVTPRFNIPKIIRYGTTTVIAVVFSLLATKKVHDLIAENTSKQSVTVVKNELESLLSSLNPQEVADYVEVRRTDAFFDEAYREELHELANRFELRPEHLLTFDDTMVQKNVHTLFYDPVYRDVLENITNAQKPGRHLSLDVIPLVHLEAMKDPAYQQAVIRMAELGMKKASLDPSLLETMNTDSVFEVAQALSQNKKVTFDAGLFKKDIITRTIKFSVYQMQEWADSSDSFLGHLAGSIIDEDMIQETWSNEWGNFFSRPNAEKRFSTLRKQGYALSSFYRNPYNQDLILSPQGHALLMGLASHIHREDLARGDMDGLFTFYDQSYVQKGIENEFIADVKKVSEGGTLSLDKLMLRLSRVGVFENIYLPLVQETERSRRLEDEFFKDPALECVRTLGYHRTPPLSLAALDLRQQAQWIMSTCRTMRNLGMAYTDEAFEETLRLLIEQRSDPAILDQSLFTDRNVVVFGHNEQWDTITKQDRFAGSPILEGIKDQSPSGLELFKAKLDGSDMAQQKKSFLQALSERPQLTLFIDAHGLPDAILLSNSAKGSSRNDIVVSSKEIANQLIIRFRDNKVIDRAIIIESACMSFEFINNISAHIQKHNMAFSDSVPLPICIGLSEYGQYGFSAPGSEFGDEFNEELLDKNSIQKITGTNTSTIRDVLKMEQEGVGYSNISVFIPVVNPKKKEVLGQIAENAVTAPDAAEQVG